MPYLGHFGTPYTHFGTTWDKNRFSNKHKYANFAYIIRIIYYEIFDSVFCTIICNTNDICYG